MDAVILVKFFLHACEISAVVEINHSSSNFEVLPEYEFNFKLQNRNKTI